MTRTKRRFPWGLLALALIVVPLVELYVLIQVGQVIGAWPTIAGLVLAAIAGSWLIKREGGRAWRALQEALAQGRMPAREIADGILILIGGTLMLAPGFLSDIVGLALILPLTRPLGRRALTGFVTARLGVSGLTGAPRPGRGQGTEQGSGHQQWQGHDVIRGDVVD